MPFQKGHNQSTGRPKGSTNQQSKAIREASAMLLSGQMETLEKLLPTLKPNEYLKAIAMLYKVVVPNQIHESLDVNIENIPVIDMSTWK
jgi:hypothetical protein